LGAINNELSKDSPYNKEDNNNATNHDSNKIIEPFISIHLPFYNEKNVARRIIEACQEIHYKNFEIIVADDSRDETIDIIKKMNIKKESPKIKIIHRNDRSGFKGGALQNATKYMNPKAKYVVIFDADFIPPPDILKRFLWYFQREIDGIYQGPIEKKIGIKHRYGNDYPKLFRDVEGNLKGQNKKLLDRVDNWYIQRKIGVVQGYQLHHLNKNENWITKGIRAEFSGGYMIERVAQELFGSMKMITGSVFMIRTEILKNLGWSHSITEDWDLTLRMYLKGYKVLYTPLIQAPAEIPTTIRALYKQRMRWAEGHTFAVKKYFMEILGSHNITNREKLEFIYYAPYYLQSLLLFLGTIFWFAAEFLGEHPLFWSAHLGWSLVISNFIALPLMNLTGLFLEQTSKEDFSGVFSFIVLTYLLTPFQAYAALKGLFAKQEGNWVRTHKTGRITENILRIRIRRLLNARARRRKN